MKLGFIGCGNMAKAMIGGIIKSGACPGRILLHQTPLRRHAALPRKRWGLL